MTSLPTQKAELLYMTQRYMCVQELAPKALPHSLQLVGERNVRAVVKLRFRDISGHTVTCHRMLQALQKVCYIAEPHMVYSPHSALFDHVLYYVAQED